jgi:hypothetical protein
MTLLERIQARLCAEADCKRAPAYPGQRYCETHRERWTPTWRRNLTARDETGRLAA